MQPCDAYTKIRDKEIAAIKEENKRRTEADIAKTRADQIAKQNAYDEKQKLQREEDKKPKSGELLINGNDVTARTTAPVEKEAPKKLEKNYLYSIIDSYNSNLYNLLDMTDTRRRSNMNNLIFNNDTVFNKNEFQKCIALPGKESTGAFAFGNKLNFPANIAIVILNEEKEIPAGNGRKVASNWPIADLVDSKGKRILNNDDITAILHFADDYFILFKGSSFAGGGRYGTTYFMFDDAEIYNYKTKTSYAIRKQPYQNTAGWVHGTTRINFPRLSYAVGDNKLWKDGTYKAFFLTEVAYRTNYVAYYVTNNGTVEAQEIVN